MCIVTPSSTLVYVTLCNCLIGVLVSCFQLRLIDLLPHGPINNHIAQLPEPVNDPTIMDEASLEKIPLAIRNQLGKRQRIH